MIKFLLRYYSFNSRKKAFPARRQVFLLSFPFFLPSLSYILRGKLELPDYVYAAHTQIQTHRNISMHMFPKQDKINTKTNTNLIKSDS